MKIFNKTSKISEFLSTIRNENKLVNIGFVPTMGALHKGHLSLIKKSKSENNITVCSIYVNPLQFNDKKDFEKYPRNYDIDIELLKRTDCDVIFMPLTEEMQPVGDYHDYDLNGLDKVMEGKFRPGHFRGVVYIVKKFFEIIQPDNAYFGMKDFQQLTIIKYIVNNLRLTTYDLRLINIVSCPIIRDSDGLALSSRNIRLSAAQRKIAPNIYKTLLRTKELFKTMSVVQLNQWFKHEIENFTQMKLEYFEIVDKQTLLPVKDKVSDNAIACTAIFLGDIRLIDNIILI